MLPKLAISQNALQFTDASSHNKLQVRDARIPIATNHPQVPQWIGSKPCILIMNRVDMVTAVGGPSKEWSLCIIFTYTWINRDGILSRV